MRESRLIGLFLDDINKQRSAAGASVVKTGQSYVTPSATQVGGRSAAGQQSTQGTQMAVPGRSTDTGGFTIDTLGALKAEDQKFYEQNGAHSPSYQAYLANLDPSNPDHPSNQPALAQGPTSQNIVAVGSQNDDHSLDPLVKALGYSDSQIAMQTTEQKRGLLGITANSGSTQSSQPPPKTPIVKNTPVAPLIPPNVLPSTSITDVAGTTNPAISGVQVTPKGQNAPTGLQLPGMGIAGTDTTMYGASSPSTPPGQPNINAGTGPGSALASSGTPNFSSAPIQSGQPSQTAQQSPGSAATQQASSDSRVASDQTQSTAPGTDGTQPTQLPFPPSVYTNHDATGQSMNLLQMKALLDPLIGQAFTPALTQLQSQHDAINDLITGKTTNPQLDLITAGQKEYGKMLDTLETKAETQKANADLVSSRQEQLKLDIAKTQQDMQIAEKNAFEVRQAVNEHQQVRDNIQNEINNRFAANRLGVAQDTNGLDWMNRSVQKGQDALNLLVSNGELVRQQYTTQIVDGYRQTTTQALNDYEAEQNQHQQTFNEAIGNIETLRSTDAKSRREETIGVYKDLFDKQNATDLKYAEVMGQQAGKLTDQVTEMMKFQREQDWKEHIDMRQQQEFGLRFGQEQQNHLDMLSFQEKSFADKLIQNAKSEMQSAQSPTGVYSAAKTIDNNLNSAWDMFKANPDDQGTRAAADAQLRIQFSHLQNVGSLRLQDLGGDLTQSDQAAWAQISGKVTQFLSGGGALDNSTRSAMKGLADDIVKNMRTRAQDFAATQYMSTQKFNGSLRDPSNMILPSDIISDPDLLSGIHENTNSAADAYLQQQMQQQSSGGSSAQSDALPRTDRNNNPTAMTTDAAKSMGLTAGVDYVQGSQFPPDAKTGVRPNQYTAKLLGDPIAKTIQAIDRGGLLTQKGQPRWTYLSKIGLDDAKWKASSAQQKREYIHQMYQQEGGSGKLFSPIA